MPKERNSTSSNIALHQSLSDTVPTVEEDIVPDVEHAPEPPPVPPHNPNLEWSWVEISRHDVALADEVLSLSSERTSTPDTLVGHLTPLSQLHFHSPDQNTHHTHSGGSSGISSHHHHNDRPSGNTHNDRPGGNIHHPVPSRIYTYGGMVGTVSQTSPTAASTSSGHGGRRYQSDHYGFSDETLAALSSNVSQEYPYVKLSSDFYYGSYAPPLSPSTPPPNVSLSNLTPAEALSRALSNNLTIERPASRNSSYRGDESPIPSPTASLILESSFITSTSSGSGNGKDTSSNPGKEAHNQIILPPSVLSNSSDSGAKQRRRGKRKRSSAGLYGRVRKSSVPPSSSCGSGKGGGVAWTVFKLLGCAFAVGVGSWLVVKWLRPMIRF